MKVYLEIIDKDFIKFESDGTRGKNLQHIINLFEKYNINYERDDHYSTDIRFLFTVINIVSVA